MAITAEDTLDFNTQQGELLGVDVDAIFDHSDEAVKYYRVVADPYVNVRAEPSASSKDIGDKLYGMTVGITTQQNGFGKLYNEPGWVSMAWLELK